MTIMSKIAEDFRSPFLCRILSFFRRRRKPKQISDETCLRPWGEWFEELKRIGTAKGFRYATEGYESAWREYWVCGYSPSEAWEEDFSYCTE